MLVLPRGRPEKARRPNGSLPPRNDSSRLASEVSPTNGVKLAYLHLRDFSPGDPDAIFGPRPSGTVALAYPVLVASAVGARSRRAAARTV